MTLIEKFKLDHPDNNGYSEEDVKECMIGCPRSYGYVENMIEDYVGPILSEAVRDAVRDALDNLFN